MGQGNTRAGVQHGSPRCATQFVGVTLMSSLRYHVAPRDAPAAVAARVLGLTEAQFIERLPELLARGFPKADETTNLFDLDPIDEWRRSRHPQVYLTADGSPKDARGLVAKRLREFRHG